MSRAQKVARAAEILADVWEQAEDLGVIDQLRAWWGSRRAVERRRERRARRRGDDTPAETPRAKREPYGP